MRLIRNPKYRRPAPATSGPGASSGHINRLPNELLLAIFADFPTPQLLTRLGPVCSRWYTLTRSICAGKTRSLMLKSATPGPVEDLATSEELAFFDVDPSQFEVLTVSFSAPDFGTHISSIFPAVSDLVVYQGPCEKPRKRTPAPISASELAVLFASWSENLKSLKLLVSRDSLFNWTEAWPGLDSLTELTHLSINSHYCAFTGRDPRKLGILSGLRSFNYGQAFVKDKQSADIFNVLSRLGACCPQLEAIGLFTNGILPVRTDLAALKTAHPEVSCRLTRLSERIPVHSFRPTHANLSHLVSRDGLTHLHLYMDSEADYEVFYYLLARFPALASVTFSVKNLFSGCLFNFAATARALNPSLPKEVSHRVHTIKIFAYLDKRKYAFNPAPFCETTRLLFPNVQQLVVIDQTRDTAMSVINCL